MQAAPRSQRRFLQKPLAVRLMSRSERSSVPIVAVRLKPERHVHNCSRGVSARRCVRRGHCRQGRGHAEPVSLSLPDTGQAGCFGQRGCCHCLQLPPGAWAALYQRFNVGIACWLRMTRDLATEFISFLGQPGVAVGTGKSMVSVNILQATHCFSLE